MKVEVKEITQDPIKGLMGEIEYYNDRYRKGNPEISDAEYDALIEKLRGLDPENPLCNKGIIDKQPTTRKVMLPQQMASLDKLKSVSEILNWVESNNLPLDTDIVITPKYNGVSLLVNDETKEAYTRGDGEVGQESYEYFKLMRHSGFRGLGYIAGEAVISKHSWGQNFKGRLSRSGQPYKLSHSVVAGLLNSNEPDGELLQHVSFIPYITFSDLSKSEQMSLIDKYLFSELLNTGEYNEQPKSWIITGLDYITDDMLDSVYQLFSKEYPIDGLVIDINDADIRTRMGREINGNPAYAKAIKLPHWSESFETVISGYKFTVSKQGRIKGTVTFEPVEIEGTEVTQASFYNARFIEDFCLFPGVNIRVKKSGDIIPKITAVEGIQLPTRELFVSEANYRQAYEQSKECISEICLEKEVEYPYVFTYCPSCGSTLVWDENRVDRVCVRIDCRDKLISKLEHFYTTLEAEELGRPTIETLFDNGYKTIDQQLNITRDELLKIEGFAEVSADNLITQLRKVRNTKYPLARIIHAYDLFEGILGEKTAQLIFDSVDDCEYDLCTVERLCKIKGISVKTAESFLNGIKAFLTIPNQLVVGYIQSSEKSVLNEDLIGFSVCFSGIRDKQLEQQIESYGGKVVSGVNKSTTHLIVADVSQTTTKTTEARKLNIEILTIDQFVKQYIKQAL